MHFSASGSSFLSMQALYPLSTVSMYKMSFHRLLAVEEEVDPSLVRSLDNVHTEVLGTNQICKGM